MVTSYNAAVILTTNGREKFKCNVYEYDFPYAYLM